MQDPKDPKDWSMPFRVGDFVVDPGANRISGPETDRHIEPKAMQVLCVLAARQGQTVKRDELHEAVWAGRVVVDETLTRAVSLLRQVLTDGSNKSGYIQTVPKQGYRLIAPVSDASDSLVEPVTGLIVDSYPDASSNNPNDEFTGSLDSVPSNSPTPSSRSSSRQILPWSLALVIILIVGGVIGYQMLGMDSGRQEVTNERLNSERRTVDPKRAGHANLAREDGTDAGSSNPGRSDNMDAQSLYRQGRYWLMNGTTANWFYRARDAMEQAVAVDPEFAAAHASLAYIYARYDLHDLYMPRDIARARAKTAIDRALALDSESVDAYLARAILATSSNAFSDARTSIDRALEIAPNNPVSHYIDSELQLARNEPDLALLAAERALEIDPLSAWVNVNMGIVRYYRGEFHEAAEAIDTAIRIDDEYTWAYVWRAMVLHSQGRLADAVIAMRRCLELDPASESNAELLGLIYLDLMDEARARYWFEYAASLQGDDDSARLWDRIVSLAFKRNDDALLLALAGDVLGELHNARFSLVPVIENALIASGRSDELSGWLGPLLPPAEDGATHVQPRDGSVALALAALSHAGPDDTAPSTRAIEQSLAAFPSYFRQRGLEARWLLVAERQDDALASLSSALAEGWLLNFWMLPQMREFSEVQGSSEFKRIIKRAQDHAKTESAKLAEWEATAAR